MNLGRATLLNSGCVPKGRTCIEICSTQATQVLIEILYALNLSHD